MAEPRVRLAMDGLWKKPSWRWIAFLSLLVIWLGLAGLTYTVGHTRVGEHSWFRRAYLIKNSYKLIKATPITGVGLGQFTAHAPENLQPYESARFNQPVHHGFLLFITEAGLLGVSLLFLWIIKENNSSFLVAGMLLSPLIIWDHYLFSLTQGFILATISLSLEIN